MACGLKVFTKTMFTCKLKVSLLTSLLLLLLVFGTLLTRQHPPHPHHELIQSVHDASDRKVTLVIASQRQDNTSWLRSSFPAWNKMIYVTDDPDAPLAVLANRGREGMVYLTYIIDHYDRLPPVMIFQHASQYQWHNDDPLYDGNRVLERLSIPTIEREGYVNLRCVWTLGCPVEIRPLDDAAASSAGTEPQSKDAKAGSFYMEAFEHLFPNVTVPHEVGASCCAQFAVTAAQVRQRPKKDYERYRRWLLETTLPDELSGRIMEYSWHIIFGKDAVHCPNAKQCYCDLYGLCGLTCEEQGVCRSQYTLAKYSVLPKGWPDYDWDGNWQDAPTLRAEQAKDFTTQTP